MNLEETIQGMPTEEVPTSVDLRDLASEPGGAWAKGWYPGEIIEGYLAGSHQFLTQDTVSKKGDSRNLLVCYRLTNGAQVKTTFQQYNYRLSDFTAQRIEAVKNIRKEMGGVKGKWSGYEDLQRSSLALGQLGQLQKATGVAFTFHPDTKAILVAGLVGAKIDVRLGIDEESGYNEVTGLAALGTGGKGKAKGAA